MHQHLKSAISHRYFIIRVIFRIVAHPKLPLSHNYSSFMYIIMQFVEARKLRQSYIKAMALAAFLRAAI